MPEYQLTSTSDIVRLSDNAFIPADPANRDRAEYEAWLIAGGVPDPYVAPSIPAPISVTPRQARLALLQAGMLDQVETAVNAAGGATKITWEYATEINRADPMIATLGTSLNLTSEQIDALFLTASTL